MKDATPQPIGEAASAVFAALLSGGMGVDAISQRGGARALLKALAMPEVGDVTDAERAITAGIGGILAESIQHRTPLPVVLDNRESLLLTIMEAAGAIPDDAAVTRAFQRAADRALAALTHDEVWDAIEAVAGELVRQGFVSTLQVRQIVRRHIPQGFDFQATPPPAPLVLLPAR